MFNHQITPLGRWKKEVSLNGADYRYNPEGGHMYNQISPEEYAQERWAETGGDTAISENGTIDRRGVIERLKDRLLNPERTMHYTENLAASSYDNPFFANFLNKHMDMSASYEMDDIIKLAKQRGQLDDYGNWNNPNNNNPYMIAQGAPPMGGMPMQQMPMQPPQPMGGGGMAQNMQMLKQGGQFQNAFMQQQAPQFNQPMYQNAQQNPYNSYNVPQQMAQQYPGQSGPINSLAHSIEETHNRTPQINKQRIQANRQELQAALANKNKNTTQNPYMKVKTRKLVD